jgi:hypothetical protein
MAFLVPKIATSEKRKDEQISLRITGRAEEG